MFDKTGSVALVSQVRMTSTRLPGKVLKHVDGKTLLDYHKDRLKAAQIPLIVTTTTNSQDDVIESWCRDRSIPFYRGSENNVLSRYYETAKKYQLKTIIRVTSDCPLIDGDLIQQAYRVYQEKNNSQLYLSNVIERTFPRGFDFEIFSMEQLSEAFVKATEASDLEHVTPYIHKNRSGKTVFEHFRHAENFSDWRITVDTPDDFELIQQLISNHQAQEKNYSDFLKILKTFPDLKFINAHIEQKKI